MTGPSFREKLRGELETPLDQRKFGSGWLSGTLAFLLGVAVFFLALCRIFPNALATPQLAAAIANPAFHWVLIALMILAFALAMLNLVMRPNPVLGFAAIALTLAAALISALKPMPDGDGVYFGLDFFVLNVVLTGMLFVPLERLFPKRREQRLFRTEWREDLFYYFISSMLIQVLTFLAMAPATAVNAVTPWQSFRAMISSQWLVFQVIEIMFLTDLVQYWVHRAFHRVPALWRFHAVHHSAQSLDWIAGARMHILEIIVLRGLTAIPMFTLGFSPLAIQIYLLIVYFYSAFIHANIGWTLERVSPYMVTPRFHHWHHGVEREAIDVNFAIHFPLLDRLFGTYHMPEGRWPKGYGVGGHPVPGGYWKQFLYPFQR
ncbi:sterol desaturase family protein [Aestuariivirga sp.]|uniref:sterol desaturase family protein n=1 Tax=Aestuariivirga sp. TaxID=2650926 RepID=UPI0039E5F7DE